MSLECRVYQEELRSLGHGLPLYEPNPPGYDRVRIADVGYADKRFGYFHRVFNALLPVDDPINLKYGTPVGFKPLPQDCGETLSLHGIDAGNWLHSSHVKRIEGEIDFSSLAASAGASVNFSVSNHQAAALLIKYDAERTEAIRMRHFEKYMLKNYRTWLKFLRDDLGLGVDLRDIILVTGHDLTGNWATATFVENAVQGGARLTAGDPHSLAASASISRTSESFVSIPIRIGPRSDRPSKSLLIPQESGDAAAEDEPDKNQCIFIRGYRVSERLLVPRIIKAAANPEDLDMDRDSDYTTGVVAVDFDSDEGESADKDIMTHDIAFNAIFELSNADIAIIHEANICALAKALKGSDGLTDLATILNEVGLLINTEFKEDLKTEVGTLSIDYKENEVMEGLSEDVTDSGPFSPVFFQANDSYGPEDYYPPGFMPYTSGPPSLIDDTSSSAFSSTHTSPNWNFLVRDQAPIKSVLIREASGNTVFIPPSYPTVTIPLASLNQPAPGLGYDNSSGKAPGYEYRDVAFNGEGSQFYPIPSLPAPAHASAMVQEEEETSEEPENPWHS